MSLKNENDTMKTMVKAFNLYGNVKFDGDKQDWLRFEEDLMGALQNNFGIQGIEYVFTDWVFDANGEPRLPKKWQTIMRIPDMIMYEKEVPELDADGNDVYDNGGNLVFIPVTAEVRNERNALLKGIVAHNKEVERIHSGTMLKISERCSTAICSKLNKSCKGHPVKAWNWLKTTYGPIAHGIQDACTSIFRLLGCVMNYDERFRIGLLNSNSTENMLKHQRFTRKGFY
jgi:hypothetical protein